MYDSNLNQNPIKGSSTLSFEQRKNPQTLILHEYEKL
jgi:hypothetical protein